MAWSAYDTRRTLDRIEEDVCSTAEVVVANELITLGVFGTQEGVDPDVAEAAFGAYVTLAGAVEERCGPLFLDDLELPAE